MSIEIMLYTVECSNGPRTGWEAIAMCFRGGNLEMFTKHYLSKVSDGSEGVWKVKHEVKAEATGPTVRAIATDPVDGDKKGT